MLLLLIFLILLAIAFKVFLGMSLYVAGGVLALLIFLVALMIKRRRPK